MSNLGLDLAIADEQGFELQERLDRAHAQLLRCARDLDEMRGRLNQRERQLAQTQSELAIYARRLESSLEEAQLQAHQIESAELDTVRRLMQAAKFRDNETGVHLRRISRLCAELASHLDWSDEEIQQVQKASALHDIGKIGISDSILRKRGPLDNAEWDAMKQHTLIGAQLLDGSQSPLLECAREIALSHHERWDGSGYPYGLEKHEIPHRARLVMICDQYDALRSVRPYKPAYDHATVCEILLEGDGKTRPQHFDPQLLDLFATIHPRFETIWNELMLDGLEPMASPFHA